MDRSRIDRRPAFRPQRRPGPFFLMRIPRIYHPQQGGIGMPPRMSPPSVLATHRTQQDGRSSVLAYLSLIVRFLPLTILDTPPYIPKLQSTVRVANTLAISHSAAVGRSLGL